MAQFSGPIKALAHAIMLMIIMMCITLPARALENRLPPAKAFLGPLPNVRYFYEGPGGGELHIRGLAWDREGALLTERTHIYPIVRPLNPLCVNQLSEVEGIVVDNEKLLTKSFPLNGGNGYKTALDLKERTWGNPYSFHKNSGGASGISKCRILKMSKQLLFGKERTVIEVGGDFCPERSYATDIGMIEFIGFKLVRIEKNGEEMREY